MFTERSRIFGVAGQPPAPVIRVQDVTVTVVSDFETLFRTEFARLVSLGVAQTGRRDVALELAQETMLRAHDHWHELATYDSPEAWCRRVMKNLLIDHHRSRAAERRAVERLERRSTLDAQTPALGRWWDLVGPLPDQQRMIVTLYYADDRSVTEIADELGITKGSVKASLFKARRSLRRRLEAEEGSADE